MSSRRRRSKHYKIDATELSPRQAAGLTQGDEHEVRPYTTMDGQVVTKVEGQSGKVGDAIKVAQHMNSEEASGTARAPRPHFVGIDDPYGVVREDDTGRRMGDANLIFTYDMMLALRSGMICLKCLEPQEYPFEDHHLRSCEGVMTRGSRYMREWQIVDIAMEFEGETHVGPQKPLAEYEAEIEEKRLKRQFAEQIAAGKSRGRRARAT